MQTLHPQAGADGSESRAPNQIATALRGAGRILMRTFGLAFIAAAGVAGWFGIEQYVFPAVDGVVATPVNDTPWPDEFAQPATRWDAFTLTYTNDGVETHRASFDPVSRRTEITYSSSDGAVLREVELAGLTGFERSPESPEWIALDETQVDSHIFLGVGGTEPVHLSELVPPSGFEFTTVNEMDATDGTRRFEVVVDAAQFRLTDPIGLHRWLDSIPLDDELIPEVRWMVDVRPDGFLLRREGSSSSVETWSEAPADLAFESPLVGTQPAAPAPEAAPDDSTPPTTAGG